MKHEGFEICQSISGIMTDDPGRLHAIVQHWGQPGYCPERRSPPTSLAGGG